MSLRDLTHEAHKNAERQEFVKILFSGNINPKLYATFLKNQHPQYEILEVCAMMHGLLSDMPEIRRAPAILDDFIELWGSDSKEMPNMCPTVQKYMDYIMSIKDQPERLMAHIYVRHMGDLAGGQMIAAKVPGKGKMYKFNNPDELKATIRSKINDNMADEAKVCFEFATEMFKEMLEIANDFK
jgi:heme oxygenase (biliverdin-producing, ferredoxin)